MNIVDVIRSLAGFALLVLLIEWQVFHRKSFKLMMKAKG